MSKILIHSKLSKFKQIKREHYKIRFHHDSELARALWIDPVQHLEIENTVYDYLNSEDVFIDVGANIGTVTLRAALKAKTVYSIEPHPGIFQNLNDNISLNGFKNIISINTAVGNKNDTVLFSDQRSDCKNSVCDTGITVPVKRLDDIINEKTINLIKMDTEGYEKFVLEGSKKTLKKTQCVILEAIPRLYKKYGYDGSAIFDMMDETGFKIYANEGNNIHRITELKDTTSDIIAIRNIEDFVKRTDYNKL